MLLSVSAQIGGQMAGPMIEKSVCSAPIAPSSTATEYCDSPDVPSEAIVERRHGIIIDPEIAATCVRSDQQRSHMHRQGMRKPSAQS